MKKILLSTVALLALGATANAADLPARTYTKAPMMAPVMSWSGVYIGGGFGYEMIGTESNTVAGLPAIAVPTSVTTRSGAGKGDWLGTVSGGYDWQLAPTWVVGIFGDAQFSNAKFDLNSSSYATNTIAQGIKNDVSYAAGVKVGWLIAPNVLTYVNGGYTHANFKSANIVSTINGAPFGTLTESFDRDGYFIGSGVENSLDIFGFKAPGWFMKTEYRFAEYGSKTINIVNPNGTLTTVGFNTKEYVQTVTTQLSYKFNWGGPVVAKY